MEHQLAAILYADVAGYSRLTGLDEVGTHQKLDAGLSLLADVIAEHGGRKVHEAGDAILAEFQSVTAAVNSAVAFQRQMGVLHAGVAEDERLEFRIGVNLGKVIRDRGDIYGDGVNLPWLHLHDDLPRSRSEDSPSLRKRWEAVGVTSPENWK